MRKFSEGLALSIKPFQKIQLVMIYFYVVRKNEKAAINCSKIVAYSVKIVKFLVSIISEHPQKAIFLVFEAETVGPCLVQKMKLGLIPPQWLCSCSVIIKVVFLQFY